MIRINLLPKEYQRRKFSVALNKNALYVLSGGVAVLILLAAYSFFFQILPARSLDKEIQIAKQEAESYNDEINLVQELNSQKSLILTRMRTIEELDQNRDAWVEVISDLGSRITDYLWLSSFGNAPLDNPSGAAIGPQRTVIEGKSFSINSMATFLVRLKKSPFLKNIELVSVKLEEEQLNLENTSYEAYTFQISCDLSLGNTVVVETEKNVAADKLATGSEF
jgi:Tfp pilus assembly protein PilN